MSGLWANSGLAHGVGRGGGRPEALLTAGCPGLPLPAQGWTLDSAPPRTCTFPRYFTFSQGVNVGVGTGERHYLFSSCQIFQALAYQRGIASESQTPDTPETTSQARCQAAMGIASLPDTPPHLTHHPSRAVPACRRAVIFLSPAQGLPRHHYQGRSLRKANGPFEPDPPPPLSPPFTQESDSAGARPVLPPPTSQEASGGLQLLGLSAFTLRCWCSQAFPQDVCVPEMAR